MIDLSDEERKTLEAIFRQLATDQRYKVVVFGSRATGKARKYSDVDVALIGNRPVPGRTAALLNEALDESPLPYTVDVVDFSLAGDAMRSEIERNGLELFST
jgi:predicted nucleotidyltransferase